MYSLLVAQMRKVLEKESTQLLTKHHVLSCTKGTNSAQYLANSLEVGTTKVQNKWALTRNDLCNRSRVLLKYFHYRWGY